MLPRVCVQMKAIPKGNKGLAKLPKAVRNKMEFTVVVVWLLLATAMVTVDF